MKNCFIKFIVLLLASIMAVGCISCSSGNTSEKPSDNDSGDNTEIDYGGDNTGEENGNGENNDEQSEIIVEGTIHERSVKNTKYNFMLNGYTKYKILVSDEESDSLAESILELQDVIEEATGVKLTVKTDRDDSVSYADNECYISLGDTYFLRTSGIQPEYDVLGSNGYRIDTKGKSILISGKHWGVLWGVYDFLEILVGFKTYSNKYYSINKDATKIALPDLAIREVPDIEYRRAFSGPHFYNSRSSHRMRYSTGGDIFMKGALNEHNILIDIVPMTDSSLSSHRKWFSDDKTQLCYSAHGDADEYDLMVDTAIQNIKSIVLQNPDRDVLTITQMDVPTWCTCSECSRLKREYGTNAASQIHFINDVVGEVNEWIGEKQNGRQLRFVIFAYHEAELAPSRKNSDGEYEPIDETVVLDPSVSVWIAPIYDDYTISITDERSKNIRDMVETWRACTDSFWFWGYYCYFGNYLIPLDSFDSMGEFIKYCVANDFMYFWGQGNYNTKQNTGFDDLKEYLFSRLLWNCNLDTEQLIDEFFTNVYKEGADDMKECFTLLEEHFADLKREGVSLKNLPDSPSLWTKQFFLDMLGYMDGAKAAVEKYATEDHELYSQIVTAIDCESIFPRYCLLTMFGNTYSQSEWERLKSDFIEDIERLEFVMFSEGKAMEEKLSSMFYWHNYFAEFAGQTPNIDGSIDNVWESTQKIHTLGHITSENQAQGYVSVLWNETGLYFLGVIYDDTISENDMVNFWLNEDYGKTNWTESRFYNNLSVVSDGYVDSKYPRSITEGAYSINIRRNAEIVYYAGYDVNQTDGLIKAVSSFETDGKKGYVVEIYMPVQTDDKKFCAGDVIGINVSIDDYFSEGDRQYYCNIADSGNYWTDPSALTQMKLVMSI